MSSYGPIQVSDASKAHLGDVHHHHYTPQVGSEWQECLRTLLLIDPRESKDALKSRKGGRVDGTCEWFLSSSDLELWRKSKSPRTSIFWLYGHPGTGKSTLSIYLVEALEEQFHQQGDALLAYFFCDNTSKYQNSATAILRGLLYQLSMLRPAVLTRILLPEFRAKGIKLFDSFQALWHILETVVGTTTDDLVIFVDALDECDQASQDLLLQQLEQHSSRVRFFITSRPYPAIREVLEEFTSRDLASFPQIRADIDLFISDKVSKLSSKKKYTPRLKKEVTDLLTSRAEGTFLWVGLACAEMQRLPAKAGLDLLKSLPSGLNLIYNKLFERAVADAVEAQEETDDIINILKFVAVAMAPMTTEQLSSACDLYQDELESERDLYMREKIEACRFMVVVDDKYVRLLHKSVKDFLFASMTDHFPSLLGAHADLAHRCVAHLMQSFRNVQTPMFSMSYDDFYKYSAQNWVHHARYAEQEYHVSLDQEAFFQHASDSRDDWLSYLLARGEEISLHFSLFDVAAKWGITSVLEHAISTIGDAQVSLLQFKDDVESGYSNPLHSAANCSYEHIFARLLSLRALEIDGKLHLISHLDPRIEATITYRFPVSVEVMTAACRNNRIGVEIVKLLISERSSEIVLNTAVLKAIVSNESGGVQILRMLFKDSNHQLNLTPDLINRAARQNVTGHEILDILQDYNRENIQVSKESVEFVVRAFDGERLERTLKYYRKAISLSSEFLVAAISNRKHRNEILIVLLNHAEQPVNVSQVAMRLITEFFNSQVFSYTARITKVRRTGTLLRYAAANQCYGDEVVATILNQDPKCDVSETVLRSAAQNRPLGGTILRLLFAHSPTTKVTAAIIVAAMNINQISRTMHSFWTLAESNPAVNDIETRVGILLDHFDGVEPLSGEALQGLIYDDVSQASLLYSTALNVIGLLRQKYPIDLPDSFVQRLGSVGIFDETLIALLEMNLVPKNEALLQLVIRQFGVKALNYVLDHFDSTLEPKSVLEMAKRAHSEQSIGTLLSRYHDCQTIFEDCRSTGWGLYHLRHTYQCLSSEEMDLLLYSTLLHSDDDQYLEFLLDLGADPNHYHNNTPVLQFAIDQGRTRCVETLFRKGASIETLPEHGTATIRQLIRDGGLGALKQLVQILIEQGVNVNSRATQYETLLVAAIRKGLGIIARMLVGAGADVNAYSTGEFYCPLDALARGWRPIGGSSHVRVLQSLLQAGAYMAPEMHLQLTQRAVRDFNSEELWILARRISWLDLSKHGFSLIDCSPSTLFLLSRLGADLETFAHRDETVLRRAVQEGHTGVISWLLKVSQNLQHPGDIRLGSYAVQEGPFAWVRRRIDYKLKVDISARTIKGETLIHLAAAEGRFPVMKWLLERCTYSVGVLDIQDKYGRTALHRALQQGHSDVADILMDHNARMDIPDGAGHTAWDWIAAFPELRPSNFPVNNANANVLGEIRKLQALRFEVEYQRAQFARNGTIATGRLGRLLHELGYHNEAARAFENFIECGSDPPKHQNIICDLCDQHPIVGIRYICCICNDCDLCEDCWKQRQLNIHPCCDQHKSDFIPVPRANWEEDAMREPIEQWLERLMQICWMNKPRTGSSTEPGTVEVGK